MFFINGELAESVPFDDRGLAYGHGLFETVRLCGGGIPLWHYHLRRLKHGAERLGITIDDLLLDRFLDQLLGACPKNGIIKVMVTAGCGERGYRSSLGVLPNYIFQWFAPPDIPTVYAEQGISLKFFVSALSRHLKLPGIKHLFFPHF